MTPAPISVERLRELLDRATPGPWDVFLDGSDRLYVSGDNGLIAWVNDADPEEGDAHADLIAALPALLHQLAETEAEVERLKSDVAMYEHANEIGLGTIKAGQQFIDAMANDLRAAGCDVDFNRTPIVANPRAEAAERAREEATGLLREAEPEINELSNIYYSEFSNTKREKETEALHSRIAAFLAASGGGQR